MLPVTVILPVKCEFPLTENFVVGVELLSPKFPFETKYPNVPTVNALLIDALANKDEFANKDVPVNIVEFTVVLTVEFPNIKDPKFKMLLIVEFDIFIDVEFVVTLTIEFPTVNNVPLTVRLDVIVNVADVELLPPLRALTIWRLLAWNVPLTTALPVVVFELTVIVLVDMASASSFVRFLQKSYVFVSAVF